MKKIITFTILSLFVFHLSFGQDHKKYSELIKEAWNLYEAKEYFQSGQKYNEAFAEYGGSGVLDDLYNAGCSWALANQPDSAFRWLSLASGAGNYTNLKHITTDLDLNSLHNDERWSKIIETVKFNKEKAEANFDKDLVAILDTIYDEDQKYRARSIEIEKTHSWDSDEVRSLWKTIHEKDSINLIKVRKILDERGWLGADIVGEKGNSALFLVIQHSDQETQEKYLPMMREAVKKGNAKASSLALLEDRVALGKGEKQIYGSQLMCFPNEGCSLQPLADPDNVDKRRAEVGLGPIKDYVANWGIVWDVEEYKKQLSEYEEKIFRTK